MRRRFEVKIMIRPMEIKLDGKKIRIYRAEGENLPVIYANDDEESGEEVLKACTELSCPPFHLVTVSGMDWDESLSPWASALVVTKEDRFAGKGPEYLEWFLNKVMPYAEERLGGKPPVSVISGYSMAGLFALWAMYETDAFAACVCASGSLWFPGFEAFAKENEFAGKPEGIYLSLGDRESKTRHPVFRTTEGIFRNLYAHYTSAGIPAVFELNAGNHFQDVTVRMAKGYRWILERWEQN